QKKEVKRLAEWLTGDLKPDVIVFSNMLTAGCVPEIKRHMNVPVVVTLQGDDIFLRAMPQPQQAQALAQIARLAESIDGFITNSEFYAGAMAEYLSLSREKIAIVPLGIDVADFQVGDGETEGLRDRETTSRPPTVGYLARLAPEKGLHILAEAFI